MQVPEKCKISKLLVGYLDEVTDVLIVPLVVVDAVSSVHCDEEQETKLYCMENFFKAFHEEKQETRGIIFKRLGEITSGKVKKSNKAGRTKKCPKDRIRNQINSDRLGEAGGVAVRGRGLLSSQQPATSQKCFFLPLLFYRRRR